MADYAVMNCNGIDREPGVIPTRVASAGEALHALHETIGELQDRLVAVLLPSADVPCPPDSKLAEVQSPLHGQLVGVEEDIERATHRLGDILKRLQL